MPQKKGTLGTIELKVIESRDLKVNYFSVEIEQTEKKTEIKKKPEKNAHFEDSEFSLPVTRPHSDLVIEAYHTHKLLKDKIAGILSISVQTLQKGSISGWQDLHAPQKESVPGAQIVTPKVGEVRIEVTFVPTEKKKEVLKGHSVEGSLTEENDFGSIINNPDWIKNPQYLLSVKDDGVQVALKLRQPEEGAMERMTFYVLRYDESFYKGEIKSIYDLDELLKVDNFNCPIAAPTIDTELELDEGEYICIVILEERGINKPVPFTFNVSCKDNDDISLQKLPLEDCETWSHLSAKGDWTSKTSGGGDIRDVEWTKNPQYLLKITKKANTTINLVQNTDDNSIGMYVIEAKDKDRKEIDFGDQVTGTEKFKFSNMTGISEKRFGPGEFIIIPCTFEPKQKGTFSLEVWTQDKDASLKEIKKKWKHQKSAKGTWEKKTAGGSPNDPDSFVKNPQFLVKLTEKPQKIAFQLIQNEIEYSIGFIIFEQDKDEEGRIEREDISEDSVFCKAANWTNASAVVTKTKIKKSFDKNLVFVPSTLNAGEEKNFKICVYSDEAVEITSI